MAGDEEMRIDEIWFTAKRRAPTLSNIKDIDWEWVRKFMGWDANDRRSRPARKR